MIKKENNNTQQPNTIDKISSEEDNDQIKSSLKVTNNDQTAATNHKGSLDTLLNKTEQFLQSNNHKQGSSANNANAPPEMQVQPISTREQRIQRIRSRVQKLDNTKCSAKEIDANYKIVCIGDANVGKTSMLLRFADDIFNQNPLSTIGVDFKIKTLKVDKKIIKMQCWDTAGQERFQSISQAYFRNSNGCLAVYDITNRESFESLKVQVQNYIQLKYGNSQTMHPQFKLNHQSQSSKKREQHVKNKEAANKDLTVQYLNTEGMPQMASGIKRSEAVKNAEDKQIGNKSQKVTDPWNLPMLKNIVIVGTKQDLVITPRSASKRKVEFSEVVEFCRQFELSGCLEVSSRVDIQQFQQYQKLGRKAPSKGQFADLNDAYFMLACNCVDYTTRQLMIESAEHPVALPEQNMGLSTTSLAINPRGPNQLNQTMNYGNQQKWCAQSEEGLVHRARLAHDSSFYSFRLQAVGNRKAKGPGHSDEESVYDGMIYRKAFPRDRNYQMTTSDSSFNRNNCC